MESRKGAVTREIKGWDTKDRNLPEQGRREGAGVGPGDLGSH